MLKGKVALITGSVRGIGKAISLCFAKAGAKIVLNYNSEKSEEEAQKLVEEIQSLGTEVIAIKANVSIAEEAKQLVEAATTKFGRLDILVNNAGITKDMLLVRMSEKEFNEVLDVNLKGVFNCTKQVTRKMLRTGGCIINMTSVVGIVGNVGQSNYAASKAGVIGFTKSVAKEFAAKNIRINAIAPGFIQTDMTKVLSEQLKDEVIKNIPMKRFGASDEVAHVALFLASDLSSYITGEVIKVDGGMAM